MPEPLEPPDLARRPMQAAPGAATAARPEGDQTEQTARQLLGIIRELATSLHPHRRLALEVRMDSRLDRDLGFDSLGRVELLLRIERAFRVRLPETLLAEAETPTDLLRGLLSGFKGGADVSRRITRLALEAVEPTPAEATTLVEVLEWHCQLHPDRPHILLDDGATTTDTITFERLRASAQRVAAGLRGRGIEPGSAVAIMLPSGLDYFSAFFGALYAGVIPVPIYPPFRPSQLEDHLRRQAGIIGNARAALLLTDPAWHSVANLLVDQVRELCAADTVEGLSRIAGDVGLPPPRSTDVALLQYTSGSTGSPKGVVLTHANLLANIRAIGEALAARSTDVFVSWLPLYHDMGLIGAWLGSLYHSIPVAIMPPLRFLARPENWLWALHRYRATLSVAPNFAYELCLRKLDERDLQGLDLSCVRLLLNGAEAVNPATIREFAQRFSRFGLPPTALAPVYGLAECSVGLAFPPLGREPLIDRVQRTSITRTGAALPAAPGDVTALEFVACGHALPRHEIRIVDDSGVELPDRREGRLQFRGPSATSGYLRNPEKTHELFDGTWLQSGDLAYTVAGDIFITGRSKDIIIRAGRHIYPDEVEEAVSAIDGVRKGCVVVFGAADPRAGTERVVIVAETHQTDPARREQIRRRIDETATSLLEAPADDIVLAAPRTVLKTSSGKIRRAACRELYEHGMKTQRPPPVWWQYLRLRGRGLHHRSLRIARLAGAQLYAAFWWSTVALFASLAWLLVALLPGAGRRWRVLHHLARLCLRILGMPLHGSGLQHLPPAGAVIVANHSSYLDGVVLCALLREPALYVAKQELAAQFFAGRFLRRIGTLFVERSEIEKGIAVTGQAIHLARQGARIVFFPEGTLTRRPGLLPFHLGPFITACAASVPVVPLSILGTRSVLRGNQWFPRHATLRAVVSPAIPPGGQDWSAALALREAARGEILKQTAEPDLAEERIRF